MALTGLDIFKLLPKTNCGECGAPTCLAFAMKLARKKAELKERLLLLRGRSVPPGNADSAVSTCGTPLASLRTRR